MHRSQGRSIARHRLLSLQQIHRTYIRTCWSDRACSRLQTDSARVIQRSLKLLVPTILVLNSVHTYIEASSQTFACLDLCVAVSHVTVWHSLSMSTFVNVAYATSFFYASGADASPELDALFILTVVLKYSRRDSKPRT